ncbi:MFS transporter [Caenispirillum bisanense]|uniref:Predicted arabinose efflux permease, MFS family n=1 Tax=Caenispirillum bisanense TaxID=414052 RepID=A0A286GTN5_9PROT|nr:MFS transporter [Caenispirillum bisanense]SOD98911.1 Predicted arabinose efflux permease, MFS family [Caenispirillum bisanense]
MPHDHDHAPAAAPPAPPPGSPLRDPAYRRLFLAQVTSLVGTGLTTVALALLAHDMAGGDAGAVLGSVLALKMVAYVVVAPAVGGIAHLLPRKSLLVALDLIRAAIVACLPLVSELWQVYALIVVLNVAAAGFTPTFQATIPDLLPDEARYTRALSLSRLAYDLEALASPALAAAALAVMTYDGLFLADAATFVVSALLVAATAIPAARPAERTRGVLANLGFGLRGYLKTPRLRGLLALNLAAAAGGAMVIVNTVVYTRDRLGLDDTATAWAMAAAGGGSMVAAILLPRVLSAARDRAVMLGAAALLLTALVIGAVRLPAFPGLIVLWIFVGLAGSAIQTPGGRLLRQSCRPGDRPAFFAAQFALSHACWLVAYPTAGLVGAWAGLDAAFWAAAGLVLIGLCAAAGLWPATDAEVLTHRHAAVDHEHLHVHGDHHDHAHEGWEGPEPHRHPHRHRPVTHAHAFTIDLHHPDWPNRG